MNERNNELASMLMDLQDLLDGRYLDASEINIATGIGTARSEQILTSIQKFKSLSPKELCNMNTFDVLAEYTGDGKTRQWVSTGAWLYSGESIGVVFNA